MTKQREARRSAAIIKALNALPGCLARKRHISPFSIAGDPDVFGSINGRHFELEVKLPGEKPTDLQRKRLEEWASAGAITGVVTSPEEALALVTGRAP